jgi:anti-sigma B factor antagonist
MAVYRRIQVSVVNGTAGNVALVKFNDRRIIEAATIQELGEELASLVEQDGHKALILNFTTVDFLSSAALNQLIKLNSKVKNAQAKMRLCGLKPEIKEVFEITKLTKVFELKSDETEALKDF